VKFCQSQVGLFAIAQKFGNYADCLTAGIENGIGDRAHHSDMTSTINQPHITGSHPSPEVASGLCKGRIVADGCTAEHAGGFHER
jgi:hypothetical protein